jgi:Dna[CI] antecedent, DciA
MDAIEHSDTLSSMLSLQRRSASYLKTIELILPPGLSDQLLAGPIEDDVWCLLVKHNAAAAKLRQLLPAISAHLRSKGHNVQQVRIKLMSQQT